MTCQCFFQWPSRFVIQTNLATCVDNRHTPASSFLIYSGIEREKKENKTTKKMPAFGIKSKRHDFIRLKYIMIKTSRPLANFMLFAVAEYFRNSHIKPKMAYHRSSRPVTTIKLTTTMLKRNDGLQKYTKSKRSIHPRLDRKHRTWRNE